MRKTKLTSSEEMEGNRPGQTFKKTPEAIQKEAEKLKGMKVPIRDKKGQFTGQYAYNVRAETHLYADTDLPEDTQISLDYTPAIEETPTTEVQHELNLNSIYVTDTPRMVDQRADHLEPQGNTMSAPASPPAPENYEDEAKELVSLKASKLGLDMDGLKKEFKGLSPREQLKQLALLEKIAPRKDEGKTPIVPVASTGNQPVLPIPNIETGPKKLDLGGYPYKEIASEEKGGKTVRAFRSDMLYGNRKAEVLRELRGS